MRSALATSRFIARGPSVGRRGGRSRPHRPCPRLAGRVLHCSASGAFNSERDRAEWQEAVDRYIKLHQPDVPVDHEAEIRKLQNVLIGMTLQVAADDPQYAASLAGRLTVPATQADSDAALLREYLGAWADDLTSELRSDPAIESAACEYAQAWAGADVAERVRNAAHASQGDGIADIVLLAVAVAATPAVGTYRGRVRWRPWDVQLPGVGELRGRGRTAGLVSPPARRPLPREASWLTRGTLYRLAV